MRERHAGQCSFDQLWYKLSRTNFDQLYCPGNHFCVTDGRLNGEEPAGAVQAPLIGDLALVEVIGDGAKRNGNTIRRREQLEVRPDVPFDVCKALVQCEVIVKWKVRRLGVQGESAKRTAQPEELCKELGRVPAL